MKLFHPFVRRAARLLPLVALLAAGCGGTPPPVAPPGEGPAGFHFVTDATVHDIGGSWSMGDGSVLIAGTLSSEQGTGYLIKATEVGTELFSYVFDVPLVDLAPIQDNSGFYALGEDPDTAVVDRAVVYRLDREGLPVWSRRFPASAANAIIVGSDYRPIITGAVDGDWFMAKLTAEGDTLWWRETGDAGREDCGLRLIELPEGATVSAGMMNGETAGTGVPSLFWVFHDTRFYGSRTGVAPFEQLNLFTTYQSGSVILGGHRGHSLDEGGVWLRQLSTANWSSMGSFTGVEGEGVVPLGLSLAGDTAFYIVGYRDNPATGLSDVHLMRFNSLTEVVWQQDFGSSGLNEFGANVFTLPHGGALIVGIAEYGGGNRLFTIRVTAQGGLA